MVSKLINKAINPKQYDGLGWGSKEDKPSPIRNFFIDAIRRRLASRKINSLIDIGSGVGHMFPLYKELRIKEVVGIEPSKRNVEISKELHPDVGIIQASLEEIKLDKTFDCVVMVMTMLHIKELDPAFKKIFGMLNKSGIFVLIDSDVTYETCPKWDWKIEVEENADGSYTVGSERKYGYLASITRPIDHFIKAANGAGFNVKEQTPLYTTAELLKDAPYYEELGSIPLAQLFVFEKSTNI